MYLRTFILLVILASCQLIAQQAFGQTTDEKLKQARLLVQAGALSRADSILTEVRDELGNQTQDTLRYDYEALATSIHLALGKWDKAEHHARNSVQTGEFVFGATSFEYSTAWNMLGITLIRRHEVSEALEAFRTAYEILQLVHDADLRFHIGCLNNIASIHIDYGMYAAAITELNEALRIANEDPRFATYTSDIYSNLSIAKRMLGQYDEAEKLLRLSRETYIPLVFPRIHNELSYYARLAAIQLARKEYTEAIGTYETLYQLTDNNTAYQNFAVAALSGLGQLYIEQNQFNQAGNYIARNRKLLTQQQDLDLENWLKSTLQFAQVLVAQGDHPTAISLLRDELPWGWNKKETWETTWDGYILLGSLLLDYESYEDAQITLVNCTKLDSLLSTRTAMNPSLVERRIATRELQARYALYGYQDANEPTYLQEGLSCIQSLDTLISRNRMMLYEDQDLLLLDARHSSANELGLDIIWRLFQHDPISCDLNMVLKIMEQNKANALERSLLNRHDARFIHVPDSVVQLLRSYTRQIEKIEERTKQLPEDEALLLRKRAARLSTEREKAQLRILQDHPNFHALLSSRNVVNLNALISNLGADHLFVEYQRTSSGLYALSVLNGAVTFTLIPATIEEEVSTWTAMLANPTSDVGLLKELGEKLTTKLLLNLHDGAYFNRLTVIPDQETGKIPFAALVRTNEEGNLTYLCQTVEISSAVSASMLGASPYKSKKILYKGFAPQYGLKRNVPNEQPRLSDTPFSRRTVSALGKDLSSITYVSGQASLANFLQDTASSTILHFAGHSSMNHTDHLLSSIHFSAEQNPKNTLTAETIYSLYLDHDLVILGSCHSGDGVHMRGEGILDLSRAFHFAGCRSIVSSLWSVPDETSARISKHLVQSVAGGKAPAKALQESQQKILNDSKIPLRLKHPYHWAGFTLYGPQAEVKAHSHHWLLLVGCSLLAFALSAVFILRKRRLRQT